MKKPNKVKLSLILVITITCFILAMAMFMQFKLVTNAQNLDIESMRKSELTQEIADVKQKTKDLQERLEEIQNQLELYSQNSTDNAETKALLEEEKSKLELILGLNDVTGSGLRITLNDENSDISVSDSTLLLLVNDLKNAGAQAISINGQRVALLTDIVYIDDTIGYIKVNSKPIDGPYVIDVIGDGQAIETIITQVGGQINTIKQSDIDVQIEKVDKISIKKYDLEYDSSYFRKEE